MSLDFSNLASPQVGASGLLGFSSAVEKESNLGRGLPARGSLFHLQVPLLAHPHLPTLPILRPACRHLPRDRGSCHGTTIGKGL